LQLDICGKAQLSSRDGRLLKESICDYEEVQTRRVRDTTCLGSGRLKGDTFKLKRKSERKKTDWRGEELIKGARKPKKRWIKKKVRIFKTGAKNPGSHTLGPHNVREDLGFLGE